MGSTVKIFVVMMNGHTYEQEKVRETKIDNGLYVISGKTPDDFTAIPICNIEYLESSREEEGA